MLVLWLQFQNHRYVTSIEAVVVDGMLETWLGILMKKYGCNLNAWFFLVWKPDLMKFYQLTFLTVVFFFHLVVSTGIPGTPFCVGRLPTPTISGPDHQCGESTSPSWWLRLARGRSTFDRLHRAHQCHFWGAEKTCVGLIFGWSDSCGWKNWYFWCE